MYNMVCKDPKFCLRISVYTVLSAFIFLCTFQVNAEPTSKTRYDDFYRRIEQEKRVEKNREKSKDRYIQSKKNEMQRYEKIEAEYARIHTKKKADIRDQFAEKWMADHDKKHEEALDRARLKYISTHKNTNKYKIPEDLEYDVK